MPFLRVIRDRRGYETTYLLHWYREGARQRSKILYVFRTPGGVRVGRGSLDPEIQREIEERHPDIAFDWSVVRDNQQIVEAPVEQRRRRPKREEAEAPSAPFAGEPPRTAGEPAAAPDSIEPPPSDTAAGDTGAADAGAAPQRSRPPIPARIEGATPDEQIAFLSQWYPIVCERIPLRTGDPARVEALLALAERLNPAAWTDADQITAGLQQASEALERLSHVFARRRRRPRRRSDDAPPGTAPDRPLPAKPPE